MDNDEDYQIESWVAPLSSIEKPRKIEMKYMKKHLNEIYDSIAKTNKEDEILDYYFEIFFEE